MTYFNYCNLYENKVIFACRFNDALKFQIDILLIFDATAAITATQNV